MKTPNFIVWLPMILVVLFAQAYTKPDQDPGIRAVVDRGQTVDRDGRDLVCRIHFVPGR